MVLCAALGLYAGLIVSKTAKVVQAEDKIKKNLILLTFNFPDQRIKLNCRRCGGSTLAAACLN